MLNMFIEKSEMAIDTVFFHGQRSQCFLLEIITTTKNILITSF